MSQRTVNFLQDLKILMMQYGAEMEIETSIDGWDGERVEGVAFSLAGESYREYTVSVPFGGWLMLEDVEKALEKEIKNETT